MTVENEIVRLRETLSKNMQLTQREIERNALLVYSLDRARHALKFYSTKQEGELAEMVLEEINVLLPEGKKQ